MHIGALVPVLFWIHGGHFEFGSGEGPIYESAPTANMSDVVVVTINYRLGALGWLYINVSIAVFHESYSISVADRPSCSILFLFSCRMICPILDLWIS